VSDKDPPIQRNGNYCTKQKHKKTGVPVYIGNAVCSWPTLKRPFFLLLLKNKKQKMFRPDNQTPKYVLLLNFRGGGGGVTRQRIIKYK